MLTTMENKVCGDDEVWGLGCRFLSLTVYKGGCRVSTFSRRTQTVLVTFGGRVQRAVSSQSCSAVSHHMKPPFYCMKLLSQTKLMKKK